MSGRLLYRKKDTELLRECNLSYTDPGNMHFLGNWILLKFSQNLTITGIAHLRTALHGAAALYALKMFKLKFSFKKIIILKTNWGESLTIILDACGVCKCRLYRQNQTRPGASLLNHRIQIFNSLNSTKSNRIFTWKSRLNKKIWTKIEFLTTMTNFNEELYENATRFALNSINQRRS